MTDLREAQLTATELLDLKTRLAKVHRVLTAGGMWPLTKGHVSARIPGTDRVLILGHIHAEGRTLDTTTAEDLCTISIDGTPLEGRTDPVDERFLHTAILRARPDVNSIVHCHCTYATALGISDVNVIPVGNRGGIFAPQVPILKFDGQIDTPERGEMVREALGDGCAVVLKNHGVVAVGESVEHACVVAFALEETAHLQWIASLVGTPAKISSGEVRRVLTGKQREEYFDHVWQHYEAMDPARNRQS
jgi:ribulose-5-phosphate 4-epimerase/fuculose-1-phosphate aldolase